MFDIKSLIKEPAPGERFEAPLGFNLFDRRALQPLEWLPGAVQVEGGPEVSAEALAQMAEKGWYPVLEGPWLEPGQRGVPLYAPSRIAYLLGLRCEGYEEAELKGIAEQEEQFIDAVLSSEDWTYTLDDDLELLVRHSLAVVEQCELELTWRENARSVGDIEAQLEQHRKFAECYCWMQMSELPLEERNRFSMAAFELRFNQEMIRVQLLRAERSRTAAGFSPFVQFRGHSFSTTEGFKGEELNWRRTLEVLGEDESVLPIRVPGFVLRQGLVVPTRTLTPTDYERLWKEHRLDEYLLARAEMKAERRCLHCHAPLPSDADERRQYCGQKCRNAARQKRFRANRPDRIFDIQQRYYSTIH